MQPALPAFSRNQNAPIGWKYDAPADGIIQPYFLSLVREHEDHRMMVGVDRVAILLDFQAGTLA